MSIHIVPVQPSSRSSQRPTLDRGARVLMIDQGSDIGVGLLLMLRIWGHSVSVARTWRHGLLQARDLDAHVVLVNLDLLLPGTLGSTLHALRADARTTMLVALKDGMPYFVEADGNAPRLKLATTPALKAAIRELVESAEVPAATAPASSSAIPIRSVTSAAG